MVILVRHIIKYLVKRNQTGDKMDDKEILEKMLRKTSQQLLVVTIEKIEIEVKAEDYLNQITDLQKQLEEKQRELDIIKSQTGASIEEVTPEELNLPPINK